MRSLRVGQPEYGAPSVPDLGNLPALDVAIGLAFVYFLLSTVCSAFNEGIATVLGWRAKTLEDAIRNLLGEPKTKRTLKAAASEKARGGR